MFPVLFVVAVPPLDDCGLPVEVVALDVHHRIPVQDARREA